MFKALIDGWRSQRAERELYLEFVEMLEMDWAMFEIVMEVLAGRTQADEVDDDLRVRDIEINRKERAIRRRLVEHMSLNQASSVPGALVLMSVVKDAERVGDYCKNLLEVAQMLQTPANDLRFCAEIVDIGQHVTQIFKSTIEAFSQSDEDVAREIIEDETLMNRRCDALVAKISRSDLSANEAVCSALWIRFLKRIEAHLSNVCSSLVLPVHRIDYRLHYEKRSSASGKRLDQSAEKPETSETPGKSEPSG